MKKLMVFNELHSMNKISDIQLIINFEILRVWEAKRFGIPKGQVSPLYKGCRGISLRGCLKKVIESRVFLSSSFCQ